jgi:hypothetical protein
MAQQIMTLIAALVGAFLGFTAPLVSGVLTRRDKNTEAQRVIAAKILELFDTSETLEELMLRPGSLVRRRLYILALQLESVSARTACMRLISIADGSLENRDELQEAWYLMMSEVGTSYRYQRSRGELTRGTQ